MIVRQNQFYNCNISNLPLQHYPLANIITKGMVNLVFTDVPDFTIISGSKSKDKKLNETLQNILKENKIKDLLQTACEYESYSGAVAFKPILDESFSQYPIFVPYPKEDIEVLRKYGFVTDVIFKDNYTNHKEKYILFTICGKGYIKYKLYLETKSNKQEVPIDTLTETQDLKDLYFYNKDGSLYNKLLCVYKENKTDAVSDYKNSYDDFAALDEIYSNMIDFIRKSKIKTYMPESLMQLNVQSGRKEIKSEYDTDYIILHDSNPAGTNIKAERDIVDVNNSLQGYQNAFNNVLLNALSTAGLSPATVGLDISGANSSALALNIRERVSMRTKAEKQNRWSSALQDIAELMIALNNYSVVQQNIIIDTENFETSITFMAYESPTYDEKVTTLGNALNNNLISLTEALKQLYPGKTDEDLEIMKMEIDGQLLSGEDIEDKELQENNE